MVKNHDTFLPLRLREKLVVSKNAIKLNLGIFKIVRKNYGNFSILVGNSLGLDLVTLVYKEIALLLPAATPCGSFLKGILILVQTFDNKDCRGQRDIGSLVIEVTAL